MSPNALPISPRSTIKLAAFVAVAIVAALALRSWLSAHDASTELSATLAAQKQVIGQISAREQQREATLASALAAITKAKNKVQTPEQAAAAIPSVLPPLPLPITLTIPAADPDSPAADSNPVVPGATTTASTNTSTGHSPAPDAANTAATNSTRTNSISELLQDLRESLRGPNGKSLAAAAAPPAKDSTPDTTAAANTAYANAPAGHSESKLLQNPTASLQPPNGKQTVPAELRPAIAIIPQADLKPLYDSLQDCRAADVQLAAANANLSDEHAKLAAMKSERDAAIKAAHGTFWSRMSRAAKWLALGVALGATAAQLHPHNP